MKLSLHPLFRLVHPRTGEFVHFTRLDWTTRLDREAWCGTEKMVENLKRARPELSDYIRKPHKKTSDRSVIRTIDYQLRIG